MFEDLIIIQNFRKYELPKTFLCSLDKCNSENPPRTKAYTITRLVILLRKSGNLIIKYLNILL